MRKIALIPLFLVVVASLTSPPQAPIIGIYTEWDQAIEPKGGIFQQIQIIESKISGESKISVDKKQTYIAASYVKFLQMSGAQVVPIFSYGNQSTILDQLSKINGVLFPGGGEDINISNKWTKNAQAILTYAKEQNDKGNVFPVWGTCLGFQLLAYLTSGFDPKTITSIRGSTAIIQTLQFTAATSYLFGDITTDLRSKLSKGQGITYYNNKYGVTPNFFSSNRNLTDFWNIIATTTTSYSDVQISILQGKKYPFYAVQFHPEKNLFEWKVFADRTTSGAQMVQILSNKFVQKARLNKNRFKSLQEFIATSIYQYSPQPTTMSFTMIYRFHQDQ